MLGVQKGMPCSRESPPKEKCRKIATGFFLFRDAKQRLSL
jgi:hypothetical protein